MPEGHTLHRLAHDLDDAFAGTAPRASSPQGRFEDGAALLDGRAWRGASAWGKHLFVAFDGDLVLHVHLGLYGKFHVHAGDYAATGAPDPVGQVRLRLLTADRLAELRGATACEVLTPAEAEAIQARLGPDPLRPLDELNDPERAWHRVHRSRTAIGPLIMDQAVLAGVGNVYRSEVLFRHRLDPAKPGSALREDRWRAVWDDLVRLMPIGVATGRILTVEEDVVAAEAALAAGEPVPVPDPLVPYVYKRTGEACAVCGSRVRTAVVAGRNLFWCGRCQRL
mgnify:FL=1